MCERERGREREEETDRQSESVRQTDRARGTEKKRDRETERGGIQMDRQTHGEGNNAHCQRQGYWKTNGRHNYWIKAKQTHPFQKITYRITSNLFSIFSSSKICKKSLFSSKILPLYNLSVKQFGSEIRPDICLGKIWIQIECKGHEWYSKYDAKGHPVNKASSIYKWDCLFFIAMLVSIHWERRELTDIPMLRSGII